MNATFRSKFNYINAAIPLPMFYLKKKKNFSLHFAVSICTVKMYIIKSWMFLALHFRYLMKKGRRLCVFTIFNSNELYTWINTTVTNEREMPIHVRIEMPSVAGEIWSYKLPSSKRNKHLVIKLCILLGIQCKWAFLLDETKTMVDFILFFQTWIWYMRRDKIKVSKKKCIRDFFSIQSQWPLTSSFKFLIIGINKF